MSKAKRETQIILSATAHGNSRNPNADLPSIICEFQTTQMFTLFVLINKLISVYSANTTSTARHPENPNKPAERASDSRNLSTELLSWLQIRKFRVPFWSKYWYNTQGVLRNEFHQVIGQREDSSGYQTMCCRHEPNSEFWSQGFSK